MRRLALLLALLLPLSGCTILVEWRGDGAFLTKVSNDPPEWKPGETTLEDVLKTLGPPDDVVRRGLDLILSYRYRFLKARELRLAAFNVQIFRWFDGKDVDSQVFFSFDGEDKLRHIAHGKYSGDQGVGSILLD